MKKIHFITMAMLLIFFTACKKEEYSLLVAKEALQNDALKRSVGPNIVNNYIEFVYAIALPAAKGKIVSAQAEATIAGAQGTYFDPKSYHTNSSGVDVGIDVAGPSVNAGNTATVTLNKDTNAVAFRYYYQIPEEARGKEVTFKFSAKSSNGETVQYSLGPFAISKMDMVKNIALSDGNKMYISIAEMKAFTEVEAAANASKIDLVYLYRPSTLNHMLVAPAADAGYLPGITLPASVNNNTKIHKVFNLQDRQLADLQYALYVDDIDLIQRDFAIAPNYAVDLKAEAGVWVESADKKYRAYIFINSVNNSGKSMVVSMKKIAIP